MSSSILSYIAFAAVFDLEFSVQVPRFSKALVGLFLVNLTCILENGPQLCCEVCIKSLSYILSLFIILSLPDTMHIVIMAFIYVTLSTICPSLPFNCRPVCLPVSRLSVILPSKRLPLCIFILPVHLFVCLFCSHLYYSCLCVCLSVCLSVCLCMCVLVRVCLCVL